MAYQVVGKRAQRKDGIEKVTGQAIYGADYTMPGQLYGAICRSPYPHARIKEIRTEKAAQLPGVRVVVVGADYKSLFGQFLADQPVIAYDKVRYMGEPVAAVAAEDELTAMEAVRLIEVDYEELPVVNSIEQALENKVLLHEDWDSYAKFGANPVQGTNVGDTFTLRHGDVEKGFAESDIVMENEFYCSMLQHTTIETHTAIASVNRSTKEITVYTPAQSPFATQIILSRCFGVPLEKVRIIGTLIGGGFGNKMETKAEPLAVVLAMFSGGRPVKLVYSRHEEFLATIVRAPALFKIKTGIKNDGTIVAQKVTTYWDGGAYTTTSPRVAWNSGFASCGPYKIPNAWIDAYCIATNKSLGSAYRGFGVTEATTAYEQQMDALAQKIGMDPVEFRLKNLLADGDISVSGEVMQSVAVRECLEAAAQSIEWKDKPHRWVSEDGKLCGKGLACFIKLTGTPSATSVIMKLNENCSLTILSSSREMGQGLTTAFSQMAAEALGLELDKVSVIDPVDTAFTPFDKTTTSSRSTFHGGNAILDAAEDIKEQLLTLISRHYGVPREDMVYENGLIRSKSDPEKQVHIKDLPKSKMLVDRQPVVGYGTYSSIDVWDPPAPVTRQSKRPTVMWMFGAQAVTVEVDPKTGQVVIKKVSAAHDVGCAINPENCRQQIEGSVMMGIGHALMEEMIYEDGILRNPNMVDYKVPTFMDSDFELDAILIEKPHPEGPFGAKGLGEPALAPTAAAIANAISRACGSRFNSIPIKPEHILFREEVPINAAEI